MTPDSTRILILGANGPTGRRTVSNALSRGYRVTALTRNPASFPIRHEALTVREGDATHARTIDEAVAETDAVVSAIGAKFTWNAVDVYSTSASHVLDAMRRHGRERLIVVTSDGVDEAADHGGWLQRLPYLALRRTFARTVGTVLSTV